MSTLLLVANYKPDVGFAWWLMEHFWVQLAEMGRARGMEPLLVYPEPGVIPETIRAAGIETMILPFPGTDAQARRAALVLVRERRVRMVYFTDRPYTHPDYARLRAAGVSTIVTHDHTPGDRPAVRGVKGALKAAMRALPILSADLQVCVSPLIRQRAIENARIPAARVAVVQNGIEPIRCTDDRQYAQRELSLPTDALICMTVARADNYKRIDFVIEVARRCVVERARKDLVFVFCGDGPQMQELRGLATKAGLGDRFVFAGRRSDVRKLLCSADMALHPSRGEAFSLAIVEYMSAGLALLVPDIPTVSQTVQHEASGMVYQDNNANQAADMICRLADDEALRQRIGRTASALVDSHYSARNMDAEFRAVLGDVVNRVRL